MVCPGPSGMVCPGWCARARRGWARCAGSCRSGSPCWRRCAGRRRPSGPGAVGPELERARRVAAVLALVRPLVDDLLGGGVELALRGEREAGDALRERRQRGDRVGEVELVALGEVRREREAHEAVLLAGVDVDVADRRDLLRAGVPDAQVPEALDVEDAAVLGHVELHRVQAVIDERGLDELARRGLGRRGERQRTEQRNHQGPPPPCTGGPAHPRKKRTINSLRHIGRDPRRRRPAAIPPGDQKGADT